MRVVQPSFWHSDDIAANDWHTRLVFIGLWSYVDDNGVGKDNPKLIRGTLFALDEDQDEALRRITAALDALEQGEQIVRYRHTDGTSLLYCSAWDKHQHPKNPNKPKYPRPSSADATGGESVATPSAPITDPARTDCGESTETVRRRAGQATENGHASTQALVTGDQFTAPKHTARKGRRRRPAVPIPEGWEPTNAHRELAEQRGVNLHDETEAFKAHADAVDRRQADWDAAFRQWLYKARPPANVRTLPSQGSASSQKPPEQWRSQPEAGAAFQVPAPSPGMQGRWP